MSRSSAGSAPTGPVTGSPGVRRSNRGLTDAAGHVRRRVGWEFVHVCVDDATRLAYVEVLPGEKATTAWAGPWPSTAPMGSRRSD
jgi:hypothetical protein